MGGHQLLARHQSSSPRVMKGCFCTVLNLECGRRGKARPRYQELVLYYGCHSLEGLVDSGQPQLKHV